jgi:hypothetical protein
VLLEALNFSFHDLADERGPPLSANERVDALSQALG